MDRGKESKMTKVDVISGFLGAGKTTFIKKLIEEKLKDEKTVLIENEFGDVGIDGTFLKEAGIDIKEINSGCICCSLVGDFREALRKVIEEYAPERLVIEPSGVGKLSDVVEAIHDVDLEVNALVCVVDVNKAKMYHKNFKEFFDNQIENARVVVLSRTQNAPAEKVEEVVHLIHELNEKATCMIADWNELRAEQILEVMDQHECCCGHHHDDHHEHDDHECCCGHHHDEEHDSCHHDHDHECGCGHHHGHHHADDEFISVAYETAHAYTKEELHHMLEQLNEQILRVKGMVKSTEGWLFFDYVPGEIDIREGSAETIGKIVVIGNKIDEDEIKTIFKVA